MAKSWTVSDDEKVYTVKLQNGMKWHDGEPITIEDVKWSIETAMLGSRIHSTFKASFGNIEGAQSFKDGADAVSGLKILDGRTLQITMAQPTAFMMHALGQFAPLPEHLLKDEDPAKLHLSEHWQLPIGSGPYKIVEREAGDYTILEPFEDYFLGKPKIGKVVFRSFTNIVAAAEAGELDFSHTLDVSQAKQIMEMPHMKVTPIDVGYMRAMWINMSREPFNDVRIRKALLLALDRESIVDDLYEGYGVVLPTFIQPAWQKAGLEPHAYDPEQAKQLLKEANWDADKVVDLGYYYKDEITKDFMAVVQYMWQQVGVKCEPRLFQGNLVEILYEKKDFDLCYVGLSSPEPQDATERYTTGHKLNAVSYNNPEFDRLVKEGALAMGKDNRKPIYDRIQEVLYEDIPMIPLYSLKDFYIESKRLKRPNDIYPNPWFEAKLDIHLWELEE
jgi:ABC-type transport system substrate-binding protein